MTKGIKKMEAMGFTVLELNQDKLDRGFVRQFVKYDDDGIIVDVFNFFYTKENGVEVFTNSLKYGSVSVLDKSLLEAILLNLNELEKELEWQKKEMKDFEITVSLKGNELFIIEEHTTGIKFFVESQKDVVRCIKNYIEMYVWNDKGERKWQKNSF